MAMPLYSLLPAAAEFAIEKGWTKVGVRSFFFSHDQSTYHIGILWLQPFY